MKFSSMKKKDLRGHMRIWTVNDILAFVMYLYDMCTVRPSDFKAFETLFPEVNRYVALLCHMRRALFLLVAIIALVFFPIYTVTSLSLSSVHWNKQFSAMYEEQYVRLFLYVLSFFQSS